jgi:hypothetical protein
MYIQAKAMLVRLDPDHPKRQLQLKDSKAGLAADLLSDDRRSGRIDVANAQIENASPRGRLYEKAHTTSTGALNTAVGQLT